MPSVNGAVTQAKTTDPLDVDSWRDWLAVFGNVEGTWGTAQNVYVKHNNTWKQVWIRLTDPTNFTVSTTPSSLTVTLNWTASVGADGYYIYRSDAPSTILQTITGGSSTSTTVGIPQYYTNYTYAIKAFASTSTSGAASATASASIATASTPTITSTAGTRTQTLSWSSVSGADGYTVYRRTSPTGAATTVTSTASTSVNVTIPDFYTTYYYSIAAYNTDNGTNYSAESGQRSVSIAFDAVNVTGTGYDIQWQYDATDEWDGTYPRLFIDWDAHEASGAGTIEYVIEQRNNSTGVWSEIDTVAQGTTIWKLRSSTTNTQLSYRVKVRHISTSTLGPATARYNFNNGKYRTRVNSTSTYTGWAQSSWPGTTNGQFIVNFNGTAFNIWAYQVKFEIETSFSSRITLYPNRKIRLIRPGTTVDLPDDEPSPSSYTYSVSTQNGAFKVDPYGTSWGSNAAGTKTTIDADCTITVYTRVIRTQEVAPTAS